MSEYVVYVLYSKKNQKRYVGFTSNLIARFYSHNKLSKKGWTKRYRPWEVVYLEFYENKKEAMKRERNLKSGKGRSWMNATFKV